MEDDFAHAMGLGLVTKQQGRRPVANPIYREAIVRALTWAHPVSPDLARPRQRAQRAPQVWSSRVSEGIRSANRVMDMKAGESQARGACSRRGEA